MSDASRQPYSTQTRVSAVESKSRNWLVVLDYIFYVLLAMALAAFLYYLYFFRATITLFLPFLLQAAGVTIFISVVSMILAVIFGFIGALGRLSRFAPLRRIATVYVEVIRGTPILVQLLLWGFGIGFVLSQIGFDPFTIAFNFMTALQSNSLVPNEFNAYF